MDIRKRKLKGYIVLSVLIILSLCSALAIPSMSFAEPSDVTQAASVIAGTPSVLNLNANGEVTDNFSSAIKGGQNEYIYFGSNITGVNTVNAAGANNNHTGAIKWRVLSKNDTKYSSNGSWLLWADYQLGSMQYNTNITHQNYAYYSTSLIRATLNGGKYYTGTSATADPTTDIAIDTNNSYLKIFSNAEMSNVKTANSYYTNLCGYIETAIPHYATTGIVGTGSHKYVQENVSAVNTRASNNCSATISEDGSSVTERISAVDKLFLLDYYDVNTPAYGFVDSDGKTFAEKVNPSWSLGSPGFPAYNDSTTTTSDYLKFSGDISNDYWLRNSGRYSANAFELYVSSSGCVSGNNVSIRGVRPAFVFSPSNIIYATASSNGKNSTFAAVNSITQSTGNKPEYKLYMKTNGYTTYSDVKITVKDDKLSVEKSGATGNAIILLSDKTGSGAVAYQATATFNGNGVAMADLGTINPRNYSITVLFADGTLRGSNYAENIKGSYTVSGHTIAPQDQEEVTKYLTNNTVTFELEN
ncbi:MAG: hypothetical protein K2K24_03920, partial [Clostridia bacterium]|nr:hypothetical protein [Clostridia bacterium]